jgi:hypothetical protein
MLDTEYRCQEVLPLFRNDAMETLKGLEFYLKTLEDFIAGKEADEISDLKQHADQLPTDRQGQFWAWHYPVHWDEIFASVSLLEKSGLCAVRPYGNGCFRPCAV